MTGRRVTADGTGETPLLPWVATGRRGEPCGQCELFELDFVQRIRLLYNGIGMVVTLR